jgi:hypothetical protein
MFPYQNTGQNYNTIFVKELLKKPFPNNVN